MTSAAQQTISGPSSHTQCSRKYHIDTLHRDHSIKAQISIADSIPCASGTLPPSTLLSKDFSTERDIALLPDSKTRTILLRCPPSSMNPARHIAVSNPLASLDPRPQLHFRAASQTAMERSHRLRRRVSRPGGVGSHLSMPLRSLRYVDMRLREATVGLS